MRWLFIALAACGGVPFADHGGCPDGIITEDLRTCSCLESEKSGAELVVQQLGQKVPPRVRVWIRASDSSFQTGDGYAWGQTLGPDDIVLSRWAGSWAHELLHVADLRAGVPWSVTAAHAGWDERGWTAAVHAFQGAEPHCD